MDWMPNVNWLRTTYGTTETQTTQCVAHQDALNPQTPNYQIYALNALKRTSSMTSLTTGRKYETHLPNDFRKKQSPMG